MASGSPVCASASFVQPRIAFSGVRISCDILFKGTEIEYVEAKDSLCFHMQSDELAEKAKYILKTDLAQSIKSIAGFTGFMVKTKNM